MRLVLDWDGTVTERDTLDMVLTEFGDPHVYARAEDELGRSLTLNDVIAEEFTSVTAPLDEVVEWLLEHARIRPGFRELVERYPPLIVSSGFHELIEPVLAREDVDVELRANRAEPNPHGWRVHFRNGAVCDTCAEPCKRADLPGGEVVYVGDGYSDRCAALVADRVFATGGLARYLEALGIAYHPFTDFFDVANAIVTSS